MLWFPFLAWLSTLLQKTYALAFVTTHRILGLRVSRARDLLLAGAAIKDM